MPIKLLTITSAVAALLLPAAAPAEPLPFAAVPVDDAALAATRGGYAPLTFGAVRIAAQNQARSDFLGTGAIPGTIMDNWWNEAGRELILRSVAADLQRP